MFKLIIDNRESELIAKIKWLKETHFGDDILVETNNLPLGDIVIVKTDDNAEWLMFERKSISDLTASIKDGRYEEQSFRLNGCSIPNHNITYLIEGVIKNPFSVGAGFNKEKQTLYSALFSLTFYKGFSVIRTFSLEETALFLCNAIGKLTKEFRVHQKTPYCPPPPVAASTLDMDMASLKSGIHQRIENLISSTFTVDKVTEDILRLIQENNRVASPDTNTHHDTSYTKVVKRVKKENVTTDNIHEIMLCQIPGISAISAKAIMAQFGSVNALITALQENEHCLKSLTYEYGTKGKKRKLSSGISSTLVSYFLHTPPPPVL
jgi:ERCC4-type nuclease